MPESNPASLTKMPERGARSLVIEGLFVGLACVVFWLIAVFAIRDKSTTFDETAYLAAGISHLQHDDHRLAVGNGPFPYLWQSLPLSAGGTKANFPLEYLDTEELRTPYQAGWQLLYKWENDPFQLLTMARAMTGLLGAALLAVVYFWSRSIWGLWGGGVTLLLGLFCPTLLAHSGLAASDIAAALFFTVSLWGWWSLLQRGSVMGVAGFCLGMALLLTTKLSGILMLPVMAITLALHLAKRRSSGWREARCVVLRMAVVSLLALGTWYFAVWAQFGFRYSMVPEGRLHPSEPWLSWESIKPESETLAAFVDVAREKKLFPEAYIWAYTWIYSELDERSAYFRGDYRLTGWRGFFPISFLIKTPPATLVLLALAGFLLLRTCLRKPESAGMWDALFAVSPLLVFIGVYFLTSIKSPINIGQRHLLPIYPSLYICAGILGLWMERHWKHLRDPSARKSYIGAAVAAVLLVFLAADTLRSYPNYLAYFSPVIGGSKNGWRWLVDSSLDWGQELPELRRVLARTQIKDSQTGAPLEPIYLSYFGTGFPAFYGILANSLPSVGAPSESGRTYYEYAPGLYAISATMLTAVYLDKYPGAWTESYEADYQKLKEWKERRLNEAAFTRRPPEFALKSWDLYDRARFARLCAWIRETDRKPVAHAGYAILVFRLSAEELKAAQEATNWLPHTDSK